MTHLSSLNLDELAAGLPVDPALSAHLEACEPCRTALAARRAEAQTFLSRPEARRQLEALSARNPWTRPVLVAAGLALAASLVFWALPGERPPGDGLKGVTSVQLLDVRDEPTSHAHPGDVLTLAVGAAGHRFGAIFALDAAGTITPLYPATGTSMGRLDGSARQRLDHLRVTAGNTLVIAFFADDPQPLHPLEEQIRDGLAHSSGPFQVPIRNAVQTLLKVD